MITATPFTVCDSMCSMSLTVVVIARSSTVTMRRSMSSGAKPAYDQMIVTTGILISGKMSVGMLTSDNTPNTTTSSAPTMNVYGRSSPSLTIHI